jgi:ribosomal-protein-alanine N-acetyltransferase
MRRIDVVFRKFFGHGMKQIQIRSLQMDDVHRLYRFERDNRLWFERHIASRGDAFYSLDGVREHIRQFLEEHRSGRLHPCLLLGEGGSVLGRANLKNIDQANGTAEVGYRIAESQVGKGLATGAVVHLIDLAHSSWQLKQLVAYVADKNIASARVLEKCGFTRQQAQGDSYRTLNLSRGRCWIHSPGDLLNLGVTMKSH